MAGGVDAESCSEQLPSRDEWSLHRPVNRSKSTLSATCGSRSRRVVDDMRAFHAAEPNAFKRDEIAGPPASRAEEALTIG
jgi:hypothetical protein